MVLSGVSDCCLWASWSIPERSQIGKAQTSRGHPETAHEFNEINPEMGSEFNEVNPEIGSESNLGQ